MVTLFCLLSGDPFQNSFHVDINNDQSISHLKDLIKEKARSALGDVDAKDLAVYSVSIADGDDAALHELYQRIDEGHVSLSVPSPMATIGSIFPHPAGPGPGRGRDSGLVIISPLPLGCLLLHSSAYVLTDANLWIYVFV
jgi:hypothetical protein